MNAAILAKDSKVLFGQILGLAGAIVISFVFIGILQQVSTNMGSPWNIKTLVAMQFLFCGLFALIAAGQVFADEEQEGTAALLARLPISKTRIVSEKVGAGLIFMTTLMIVIGLSHVLFDINGNYTDNPDAFGSVTGNFAIMLYSSYAFGIGVSIFVRRTIVVVMVGVLLQTTGWYLASLHISDAPLTETGILVILFAAVLMLGPLLASRFGLHLPLVHFDHRPFLNLISKSVSDSSSPTVATGIVLIIAMIAYPTTRGEADVLDLTLVAIMAILAAAIGISGYGDSDSDGLNGVVFHHPVSRPTLLLSKFCAAAIPLALLSAGMTIATEHYADFNIGTSTLFAITVYVLALSANLAFRSERNSILAAIAIFGGLLGWVFTWAQPSSEWLWFRGFTDGYADMTMTDVVAVPIGFFFLGIVLFTCWAATSRRFLSYDALRRSKIYGVANVVAAIFMIAATMVWREMMAI